MTFWRLTAHRLTFHRLTFHSFDLLTFDLPFIWPSIHLTFYSFDLPPFDLPPFDLLTFDLLTLHLPCTLQSLLKYAKDFLIAFSMQQIKERENVLVAKGKVENNGVYLRCYFKLWKVFDVFSVTGNLNNNVYVAWFAFSMVDNNFFKRRTPLERLADEKKAKAEKNRNQKKIMTKTPKIVNLKEDWKKGRDWLEYTSLALSKEQCKCLVDFIRT